jgi:xanthine dehydrogenase accessory factor
MGWLEQVSKLARSGTPFVMVTLARVRGHAPRRSGSKMLVTSEDTYGSIGGGNLEETAIARARELLAQGANEPELLSLALTPHGGEHGVQCCGGEVTLLLEPVCVARPTVAIFGAGHVGWALMHVLQMLPLALYLIDSRKVRLDEARLLAERAARVRLEHAPVPESAVEHLPAGAHLLILTHDHAEDLAILERALRRDDLGFIGLIGSAVKWQHFQQRLKAQGLSEAVLARVATPIGLPGVPGKSPQAIAIAAAAQLLGVLELPESAF